jgi:hypothetical protein
LKIYIFIDERYVMRDTGCGIQDAGFGIRKRKDIVDIILLIVLRNFSSQNLVHFNTGIIHF